MAKLIQKAISDYGFEHLFRSNSFTLSAYTSSGLENSVLSRITSIFFCYFQGNLFPSCWEKAKSLSLSVLYSTSFGSVYYTSCTLSAHFITSIQVWVGIYRYGERDTLLVEGFVFPSMRETPIALERTKRIGIRERTKFPIPRMYMRSM